MRVPLAGISTLDTVTVPQASVVVREGFGSLEASDELEDDMLDKAWGLEPHSRLSCQALVDEEDLVVEIPKYTINQVSEGH